MKICNNQPEGHQNAEQAPSSTNKQWGPSRQINKFVNWLQVDQRIFDVLIK